MSQTSGAGGAATLGSYRLLEATLNSETNAIRTSVSGLCDIAQICVAGLSAVHCDQQLTDNLKISRHRIHRISRQIKSRLADFSARNDDLVANKAASQNAIKLDKAA